MPYILLLIGILLIVLNLRALKKEKNSFKNVFSDKQENITDTELLIGQLRREFSETVLELQKEIIALRHEINAKSESAAVLEKKSNSEKLDMILEENFIDDITKEIIAANEANREENEAITIEEPSFEKNEEMNNEENNTLKNNSNNVKINEIAELLEKGHSVDDICERFKIGKGELLLIKDLYLK